MTDQKEIKSNSDQQSEIDLLKSLGRTKKIKKLVLSNNQDCFELLLCSLENKHPIFKDCVSSVRAEVGKIDIGDPNFLIYQIAALIEHIGSFIESGNVSK